MRILLPLTFLASAFCLATGAAVELVGTYTCKSHGGYDLCNDQWGASSGTGSQVSYLMGGSKNTISWVTKWTWTGGWNDVKTYANAASTNAKGMTLSEIEAVPTKWKWYYKSGTDICADVSYDIWIGSNPSGAPASSDTNFEIMIWLSAKGGVSPLGSLKNSAVSIASHTWDVYAGPIDNWETISFVTREGDLTNFNDDLAPFFEWVIAHMGVSSSLYLHQIAGGTEAFTGSAVFVTESFSASVETR
ncbi:glycoside hydrolase family 12 protein [Scleroderma citrinum Foug A]|uniref:Glycoside hydrolase family 12 protein n=1 Tax=Scleroderma citrinum Foug A TaxID=1036808 RepID=A0A0C3A3K5_9AGAM|nr:glycoside hydrolase family 12 protein [Scleroderma citrinum Foug A]